MSFRDTDRKVIHVRDKPNFRKLVKPNVVVESDKNIPRRDSVVGESAESSVDLQHAGVTVNISDPMDAQTLIDACHILANKTALDVETKRTMIRGLTSQIFRVMRLDAEVRSDVSSKLSDLMNQANDLDSRIASDFIPTILGNIVGVVSAAGKR